MRKTYALIQVLTALMAEPRGRHWGYDLQRAAHLRSGALYPILHRLLDQGWLTDGWEDADLAARETRPRRRYYEITDLGRREMGAVLAEARTDARFSGLIVRHA